MTAGSGALPNEQGQVWREYDISPYTARVTTTKRPEQAIVDWILRETGYEVWHTEPLGILSASPRILRVYHTPQMQAVVADIVDRFVSSEAETRTFSLRIVTIDSPNWRVLAHRTLRPIPAQTPGVCAWLLSKEDAAVLLGALQRRSDYREHSSPHLLVNNGQSTAVSALRGRPFIRDVNPRLNAWQGYDELRRPGRRRVFAGVQSPAQHRPPLGRCHDQVPDRPGGEARAGDVGSAHANLAAATRPGRGPADELFPLCRALSLADGSGLAAGPGDRRFAGPRRTRRPPWPDCRCRFPVHRPGPICW